MQLELRQTKDVAQNGATRRWYFERGRRTLGRSSDCDWQVPDTTRAVSKLHCAIERDRDGFLLRDESANGTKVDGVLVLEGETARLSDNSRLEFGGFVFSVVISGEKDRDIEDPEASLALSDENLTISAILADIAPGGQTANGIVGGRDTEDWPSAPVMGGSKRRREKALSSRNVEVGWSGPPETSGMQPVLPNDWNEDSDYGNRLEHATANHVSVPMTRDRRRVDTSKSEEHLPVIAPEEPEAPEETGETFSGPVAGHMPDLLPRLEALLERCEEASAELFAAFDIAPETLVDTPDLFGAGREDVAVARLEAMLARQLRLNTALEGLLKEASHAMEPRIIEARVDAEPRRLPWRGDRSYWHAYRQQFDNDGASLSVREFFRKTMLRALGELEEDEAETTGKVNRNS